MSAPLPKQLVDRMASRPYRMHNYLWHEVRNNWSTYPKNVQRKLRQAGWEPPRPAADEKGLPNLTDDSGEDYLYMHRQLIRYANGILGDVSDPNYDPNYRRIEGWIELPPPGDPHFPVPPPWFDPQDPVVSRFFARSKSDVTFEKSFRSWEGMFTDPGFLGAVSLGALGTLIQFRLWAAVRWRWAAIPGGRRPDPGPTEDETIPIEWDHPRYDYLADTYSMQVNPVYWKFHGWVDDRIEDWKLVNGVLSNEFWKGRWMGRVPEAAESEAPSGLHERLEDPEVANQHVKEIQQLLTIIGSVPGSV